MRFHDSKLKLVKALLFRSLHETEAPTACFCSAFICGRAYSYRGVRIQAPDWGTKDLDGTTTIH